MPVITPAIATPAVSLANPGLWLTGVERGLLLIGLSAALGGIAGRGLAKNYKGAHPSPLPEPWVVLGCLVGMAGAAALIITALVDPKLAASLEHPYVAGPRAAATLVIAVLEFVCFGLVALLVRVGKPGMSVHLLMIVVLAESLRGHPEGMLPLAGALLTICHLLPAVLWAGMLAYVLQAAIAWRANPAAVKALIRLYANAAAWLFVVVIVTGIASAVLLVPLHSLFTSSYGEVLIFKSALVAVVAGLALAGRLALNRPVTEGPARVTKAELAMLAAVLVVTGILTVITPPAKPIYGGSATGTRHVSHRGGRAVVGTVQHNDHS